MLTPIVTKKSNRKVTIINGIWYYMLVSPSTFYQKNLWAKKFNSRQLNNFQINIEPKLYQIPMFFRQGCIFPISLPDAQLLLLVTPGDGINKLYMDKNKPEYFFINQQENKLKIIWKEVLTFGV